MKKTSKILTAAALAVILLLQCVSLFYWQSKKSNLYVDELFSYEYAHYFSATTPSFTYLYGREDWQFDVWQEADELKKDFTVGVGESLLDVSSPAAIVKKLLNGRTYMGLLNLMMTFCAPSRYQYHAFCINAGFFVLTQLLLYYLLQKLTGSSLYGLFGVLLYGFSSLAIGVVQYIRFYCLTFLLVELFIILHYWIWIKQDYRLNFAEELGALAMFYFALRHSELSLIFCGAFIAAFLAGLWLNKRKKSVLLYMGPLLPGAAGFLYLKRNFLASMRNWTAFVQKNAAYRKVYENLQYLTCSSPADILKTWVKYTAGAVRFIADLLLGGRISAVLFVLVFAGLAAYALKNGKPQAQTDAVQTDGTKAAPAEKDRDTQFIRILTAAVLVYTAFYVITRVDTDLDRSRYYGIVFLPLAVIFVYWLWKFGSVWQKPQIPAAIVCAAIVVCSVSTFRTGNIDYIYEKDRMTVDTIESRGQLDSVIVESGESAWTTYECVNLCAAGTRIYPCGDTESLTDAELPGAFILYVPPEFDDPGGLPYVAGDILTDRGYELNCLGSTDWSVIYECRKAS